MNETKKCRECQSDVHIKAKKCPKCQTDLRNWFRRHPILSLIILVFVILPIINSTRTSLDSAKERVVEQETRASETVLGTYTINTDLRDGGSIASAKPIFSTVENSIDSRVANIPNGATVELLERKSDGDVEYDRCKIRYENKRGWLSCGWLK